jgi:hypothetical protein
MLADGASRAGPQIGPPPADSAGMRGRSNLLRIIGCGLTGAGLLLAGAGALPVGGALGSAALSSTTPAAVPPSVGVVIIPGPSLAGEATKLTLQLSVTDVAHPTPLSVTDLVPSGLRYVRGSSRLVTASRSVPLGRPRASTTSRGTLLVWSKVRVSPGVGVESLVFEVAPAVATGKPGAPDLGAAGRSWTDQATVREARAGRVALGATNRATIEVVPVSAVQIGHLLAPTKPGPVRLQESLTVSSTREGPADDVIIRVYLPGRVTWAGCVPGRWCTRPVVGELRLPVMTAQPDRPRLPPLSVGTPSVTVTHPAVTHSAAAVARPIPMVRFTVLTWRLGTLPAGTSHTLTYRLDASPLAQPRTEDLVTATASLTTASVATPATTTLPTTAPPTTTLPTTTLPTTTLPTTTLPTTTLPTTAPSTTTPSTTTPSATTPATTTPATASAGPSSITPAAGEATPSAAVVTHESAAIRASALQAWPGAAAIATVAANGADATTTTTNVIDPFGSASTTTTSPSSTSTTSKSTAGTSTTTTTSAGTSTSTTTSSTSSTTVPKAGLATTGTDAVQTGEAGLGLIGAGGMVLLSSCIRRRRRPTPDAPSGTTPTGDR